VRSAERSIQIKFLAPAILQGYALFLIAVAVLACFIPAARSLQARVNMQP
jgi:hypothetical protein